MAFAQGSASPSGAPAAEDAAGALDLHEELSHPGAALDAGALAAPVPLRCVCGPAHLRLRSEHGELVRVRGGSVNRCEYCARLAAIENCEMLGLHAMDGRAPEVLLVLTTRDAFPDLSAMQCECDALADAWTPGDPMGMTCERCALSKAQMKPYADGLRLVKRALKRKWPDAEYACLLEFTTGYAARSGGQRRPHWNLLWVGIPADAAADVEQIAARVWCQHVDAEPQGQAARSVYEYGGLARYLALHFNKESQQPPAGFTGQRFNCSRGYFGTDEATGRPITRAMARARARGSLRLKRELWRQQQRTDPDAPTDAHDVELNAQLAVRLAVNTRWILASDIGAPMTQLLPEREYVDRLAAAGDVLAERRRAHAAAAEWRIPWEVLFADAPG